MRQIRDDREPRWHPARTLTACLFLLIASLAGAQTDNESCKMCHEDPDLQAEDGRNVGVSFSRFDRSVHRDLECVDCHSQSGDYETTPHFERYRRVACADCHAEAVESSHENFHYQARQAGNQHAPTCLSCHATGGDPHLLHGLDNVRGRGVVPDLPRQGDRPLRQGCSRRPRGGLLGPAGLHHLSPVPWPRPAAVRRRGQPYVRIVPRRHHGRRAAGRPRESRRPG